MFNIWFDEVELFSYLWLEHREKLVEIWERSLKNASDVKAPLRHLSESVFVESNGFLKYYPEDKRKEFIWRVFNNINWSKLSIQLLQKMKLTGGGVSSNQAAQL